jgi:hypothetical protein
LVFFLLEFVRVPLVQVFLLADLRLLLEESPVFFEFQIALDPLAVFGIPEVLRAVEFVLVLGLDKGGVLVALVLAFVKIRQGIGRDYFWSGV